MSSSTSAVLRHRVGISILTLFALLGLVIALSWQSNAKADPYPPTPGCAVSTSSSTQGAGGSADLTGSSPSCGVDPVTTHRVTTKSVNDTTVTTSGTASTGFETFTATAIAAVLVLGGLLLLLVGRRRRDQS